VLDNKDTWYKLDKQQFAAAVDALMNCGQHCYIASGTSWVTSGIRVGSSAVVQ
jgi:hypothetical protein